MAAHVAVAIGKPAAVFSLEMSRQEVFDRLLAGRSRITLGRFRGARLESETITISLLGRGAPSLAPRRVRWAAWASAPPLADSKRDAVRGLRFAVVDYLGLLDLGAGDGVPRWERIGEASRTLKLLAIELHLTILLCVQLNREADGREPSLGQLRDSGSIEQDADRVILLHRRDDNVNAEVHSVSAIVAKNRHGPTGRAELSFNGPHTCFSSEANK